MLQTRALAETGYRAITPDLRGFGRSSKSLQSYEVREAVKDILKLLEELKISR